MTIRVALADDHPLILSALRDLLCLEKDFEVVALCGDGEDALRAVRDRRPDLLILDIRLPGKDGFAVLRAIKEEKLLTRVVLLTATLSRAELLQAVRLGASGVVLKEMAPQLLLQCIRTVHRGEQWFERRSMTGAFDELLRREAGAEDMARVLTPRELEIVRMVVAGRRNKEIGDSLYVSEGTVKSHLHHIYEKLQVRSRLELTVYAREKGLA
jgi:two-component system nitrate/nitrite response regulator NarL